MNLPYSAKRSMIKKSQTPPSRNKAYQSRHAAYETADFENRRYSFLIDLFLCSPVKFWLLLTFLTAFVATLTSFFPIGSLAREMGAISAGSFASGWATCTIKFGIDMAKVYWRRFRRT